MTIKSAFSFFAFAALASFSVIACTASTDDSSSDDSSSSVQDQELKKSTTSCNVDDDCVAVPRGGCCSNGWKEAVNKHHTKAYENATKCKNPQQICPMFVVLDQRVAQCDTGTKQCKMVDIGDIACGGFTANPHECPAGYSCDTTGVTPDLPGTCKQDPPPPPPPPPPSDCRQTGCSTGRSCSMCWGHFACIPNGAIC
jgi:hypothetical protein